MRPHATGGQIEDNDETAEETQDRKQPTLEDLGAIAAIMSCKPISSYRNFRIITHLISRAGRALRERNQVHAWIDLEIQDDTMV